MAKNEEVDAIIIKSSPKDTIKRSNFGLIRDMNNVISYISEKARQLSPIEQMYEKNLKGNENTLNKHHHLHT